MKITDLLDNFFVSEFSENLSPVAIDLCDDLTMDQIQFLSSAIGDFEQHEHHRLINAKTEIGGRPFCASIVKAHPYYWLGPVEVEEMKRNLLFFERVAVPSPSFRISGGIEQARATFRDFLQPLVGLRELIDDGTVEIVPRVAFYSNEVEGAAGLIRNKTLKDPDMCGWLAGQRALVEDMLLDSFSRGSHTANGNATKSLAEVKEVIQTQGLRRLLEDALFDAGLRICLALAYGHKLVATHHFVADLYERLWNQKLDARVTTLAARIPDLPLPGIGGLSLEDICSLRRSEEAFARWRLELQNVLVDIDPRLSPEDFVTRFMEVAKARLGLASHHLSQDLQKSSFLQRAREAAIVFAVGVIAGTAPILLHGVSPNAELWVELLKVAASGSVISLFALLLGWHNASPDQALLNHYAVFTKQSS